MSTDEVDAPATHAHGQGGTTGFADRWPFRRKLNLLVGIPLAVIAVLLSYLFSDMVRQSGSAASAARLVRDSAQVARLVDRVEAEHQQAILLSARYESGDARPSASAYRAAQRAVDSQVARVRTAFGDRLPADEAQALREVEGLSSLRSSVEQAYLPADNIDPAYAGAAQRLIDGLRLDRNADLAATFTGNLLDSLLRADAAHGAFETNVFAATTGDTNALIEFTSAVGAYDLYTHQADRFTRFASAAQAERLGGIEHTPAQGAIAQSYAELQVGAGGLQANGRAEIRRAVQDALADYPYYPQEAAARLKITTALIGEIAARADDGAGSARRRAVLLLSGALLAFALWIAFAVLVRRSVVRPVQALTGAAREVAEAAGRELARVAEDDAEDDGPPRLRDVPVPARDEIGDLAEAFNRVQTTAGALLERQVLSRRNTAEMFGNVGRRVSNLTTRQLSLIDAVERGETDPALLERLYSIDHIAVRLRRNADSLMLLAGIRETVLDAEPTALSNVVRAALGQIEGYQRVRLYAASDAVVAPDIIGDLTLMLAELLENAVTFSPEGSPVEVTVRAGDEGVHVVITDHGLGMSPERLAEENARMVRRERLDLAPTKVLGLFVVGALARRWSIAVTLTRTPGGGVTAEVTLPTSLLLTMSPLTEPGHPGETDPRPTAQPASGQAPATPIRTAPTDAATRSGPAPARASEGEDPPAPGTSPSPDAGRPAPPAPDAPLPRRIPRREPASEGERATADVPSDRDASERTSGSAAARPLRRRVRGATLHTTAGAARAVPEAVRIRDAEAERAALEEFEAAVARALHDTGNHPRPPYTPATASPHHPEQTQTPRDRTPAAPASSRHPESAASPSPPHHTPTAPAPPTHPESAATPSSPLHTPTAPTSHAHPTSAATPSSPPPRPAAADGDPPPQGPPAPDDDARTSGAGGSPDPAGGRVPPNAPAPDDAPEPGNTTDQAPSPKESRVEHVDR